MAHSIEVWGGLALEEARTLAPGQDVEVAAWLRGLGLERHAQAFRDAEITPEVLPELTDADLRELGLPLGPRKLVLKAIRGRFAAIKVTTQCNGSRRTLRETPDSGGASRPSLGYRRF